MSAGPPFALTCGIASLATPWASLHLLVLNRLPVTGQFHLIATELHLGLGGHPVHRRLEFVAIQFVGALRSLPENTHLRRAILGEFGSKLDWHVASNLPLADDLVLGARAAARYEQN